MDVEVEEKDEATLQVEVSTEKAAVSWHKDGEEISGDSRIKVVIDGKMRRLVISTSNLSDEGEYTCVLGDLETTCELTVRELPAEIVKDMIDQTVNKAEKASFAVSYSYSNLYHDYFKLLCNPVINLLNTKSFTTINRSIILDFTGGTVKG